MSFTLKIHQLNTQFIGLFIEQIRINQHTISFHDLQHSRGRDFNLAINKLKLFIGLNLGIKHLMQMHRNFSIFARVTRCHIDRDLIEGNLVCTLSSNRFIADRITI